MVVWRCGRRDTVYFINYLQVLTCGAKMTYRHERLINYLSYVELTTAHTRTHARTRTHTHSLSHSSFFPLFLVYVLGFQHLRLSLLLHHISYWRRWKSVCVCLLCIIPHAKPWWNYQCYLLTLPPVLNWRQWCGRVSPPSLSLSPFHSFFSTRPFLPLFLSISLIPFTPPFASLFHSPSVSYSY